MPRTRHDRLIVLFGALLSTVEIPVTNANAAKPDFKLQGRLGLGAETNDEDRVDDIFETRLGFRSKRQKGVRANVEVRADEGSREVLINDAFAEYQNEEKTFRIRGGRGKKILGWEYEYPTANRLSIHRSLAYQFLEDRALVGRDYFVSYQWFDRHSESNGENPEEVDSDRSDSEDKTREGDLDSSAGNPTYMIDPMLHWKLGAAIHYDESKNSALIFHAITTLGSDWRIGAWLSLQRTRSQHSRVDTTEGVVSLLYQKGKHRAALELFAGDDPYRTLVDKFYGGGRSVYFTGAKAEYGAFLGPWNPFFLNTILWRDLAHGSDRAEETVVGIRRYWGEDFSLAAEVRRTRSRSDYDPTVMPYAHETVGFVARYFF
jgi:hypothetical protein